MTLFWALIGCKQSTQALTGKRVQLRCNASGKLSIRCSVECLCNLLQASNCVALMRSTGISGRVLAAMHSSCCCNRPTDRSTWSRTTSLVRGRTRSSCLSNLVGNALSSSTVTFSNRLACLPRGRPSTASSCCRVLYRRTGVSTEFPRPSWLRFGDNSMNILKKGGFALRAHRIAPPLCSFAKRLGSCA